MISRKILALLFLFKFGAYASSPIGSGFVPFLIGADWAVTEINDPTGLAPEAVVQRV